MQSYRQQCLKEASESVWVFGNWKQKSWANLQKHHYDWLDWPSTHIVIPVCLLKLFCSIPFSFMRRFRAAPGMPYFRPMMLVGRLLSWTSLRMACNCSSERSLRACLFMKLLSFFWQVTPYFFRTSFRSIPVVPTSFAMASFSSSVRSLNLMEHWIGHEEDWERNRMKSEKT